MTKFNSKYPKLFEPGYIGKMKLRNRTVMPAMGTCIANPDQSISDYMLEYHFARAAGEIGMNVLEITSVEKRGQGLPCVPGIYSDSFIPGLARLADGIHERGGKLCVQLHHAGRGAYRSIIGEQPVGPSHIRAAGCPETPRELSRHEVLQIIDAYGDGALRAKMAGADCVEAHAGHGYMIWAFLSPRSNQRTDEYGGNFDNRFRFLAEIIQNIKQKCGPGYPVLVRLSISEELPGGLYIQDTLEIARRIEKAGGDAVHLSTGNFFDLGNHQNMLSPMYMRNGHLLEQINQFTKSVSIPVIAVGGLTYQVAEQALEQGQAAFVSFGRQSLADPEFVKKVRQGREDEIRVCIRCNSCLQEIFKFKHVTCASNPACAREAECAVTPAPVKKKISIIGAGPAGMKAALIAGQRGHEVKLYEKTNALGGGQIRLATNIKGKEDINHLVEYHETMFKKYPNIQVIFNTDVNRELIAKDNADAVIIATGAKAIMPGIPGIDQKNVVSAFDVLEGKAKVGQAAIVVGGGLIGTETAHYLALEGRKIQVVEMLDDVAATLDWMTRHWLMEEAAKLGIEFFTRTTIKEFTGKGAIVRDSEGKEREMTADTVVVAVGTEPVNYLAEELKDIDADVYTIGDAKIMGKIINAVADGFHLARLL